MRDQESRPGGTSSMQLPGSLAMCELYRHKLERGKTLIGESCLDSGIR